MSLRLAMPDTRWLKKRLPVAAVFPLAVVLAASPAVHAQSAIAPPRFSPASGTYTARQTVAITAAAPGAKIYYTITGNAIPMPSRLYTGPILVAATETIHAIAVAPGYPASSPAAAAYTISQPAAPPSFSLASGTYNSTLSLEISDATPGAAIYYSILTGAILKPSTRYSGPIAVSASETIHAIAAAPGYSASPEVTASYTILPPAPAPRITPPAGTYTSVQQVTISDSISGATIYYTTDGTPPATSSPQYTGPIAIPASTTVQAIAIADGYSPSALSAAAYTISMTAAPPVFSIPPGTYLQAQNVAITDATPGAVIRYTTDGSAPTLSSPQYTGPVTVASTLTLTAIAIAPGYINCGESSAAYNITPPAAPPLITPSAGTYTGPQTVSISSATPGASIYYTTTGIPPAASSPLYTGPVSVSSSQTIQAIGIAPGYSQSAASSASFNIQAALAIVAPAAMPAAFAGAPYSAVIQASGEGPVYAWSVDGSAILPGNPPVPLRGGLAASSNGNYALVISGTPAASGSITLNIGVGNPVTGDRAAPVSISIPVTWPTAPSLPPANPNPFPAATTHGSYSAGIAVSGGAPPYTWTVTGLPGTFTALTATPISTLAGTGASGFSGDGGPAAQAQIASRGGIAIDAAGNIYFADSASARVRRISPDGIIATAAGTGIPGYNGDAIPATQAQLNAPIGLAADRFGNLYIADSANSRIRMVSAATGQIATIAGTGISGLGGDGFAASAAQLNHPAGVALDSVGNLYIADSGNVLIRVVSAETGMISTLAGTGVPGYSGDNGPATQAQLSNPYALAVDAQHNVYVADLSGPIGAAGTTGRIRRIDGSTKCITTIAGTGIAAFNGDRIAAAQANLSVPVALAAGNFGSLYIADSGNNRIRSVNPMGVIGTAAGDGDTPFNGDGIPAAAANLDAPQGVATDASGNIYVADADGRIREVQAPSQSSQLIVQGTPSAPGPIAFQASVADSAGAVAGPVAYTLDVDDPLPIALPIPNPSSLSAAVLRLAYVGAVAASGGVPPYSWGVNGNMLGGRTFGIGGGLLASASGNTLVIGGTPVALGTVTFRAWAVDAQGRMAGPAIYSIDVVAAPGNLVTGQVGMVNCGQPAAGVTLTLATSPAQIASTDRDGRFTFSNVPDGTFTLTPSVAAPGSVFYPASQTIAVGGSPVSGIYFQASIGYSVSGHVSYPPAVGGRVYLRLVNSSCPTASPGTNVNGATGFSIRGVQPGNYTLQAWVDELGFDSFNAADATANMPGVTVGAANLNGVPVTVVQPSPVTLTSAPRIAFAGGFGGGVILGYAPILAGGVEQATAYTLQWSTASTFASVVGSRTFTASGANGTPVWIVNSLASGSVYYFRVQGSTADSVSPWSNVFGPVTIGAPTSGNIVSGTVAFNASIARPLYVGFRDVVTGKAYAQILLNPVSPQPYSVRVPTGSNYTLFAILDQNGNGMADSADVNGLGNHSVVAIAGSTTMNLTLPVGNVVSVATRHFRAAGPSGPVDSYALAFDIPTTNLVPLTVSLLSGPNVLAPFDVGECIACGLAPYDFSLDIGSAVPAIGDTYTFSIVDPMIAVKPGLSSGAIVTSTASVTGVVNAFASGLSPATGAGAGTTPVFAWTGPPGADAFTYQFTLWDAAGNVIWQIPGPDSPSAGFSSTVTSIPWGTDPTGAVNPPSVPSLTPGETYTWSIQVRDANGNSAEMPASYTP